MMMILPQCIICKKRTDLGEKCRVCAKLCPNCNGPIDDHEEGKLRNCLIKLGKQKWE